MSSPIAPFHPLRSSWLAGWSHRAGKLTLTLVTNGCQLEADVPSWVPGLLTLAKSPGDFYHRFIKPCGVRSIPAPAAPELDLVPALKASIARERSRRDPFAVAVDSYTRQFLEIAAAQVILSEGRAR